MKWNHLPEPGGLFQQNPLLLERFSYILSEQNAREAEEAKKRESNMGNSPGRGKSAGRSSGRGRRR